MLFILPDRISSSYRLVFNHRICGSGGHFLLQFVFSWTSTLKTFSFNPTKLGCVLLYCHYSSFSSRGVLETRTRSSILAWMYRCCVCHKYVLAFLRRGVGHEMWVNEQGERQRRRLFSLFLCIGGSPFLFAASIHSSHLILCGPLLLLFGPLPHFQPHGVYETTMSNHKYLRNVNYFRSFQSEND